MSDTIDFGKLLAPDPTLQQDMADLQGVQNILAGSVTEVTEKQGAVMEAQGEVVDAANTVAQNDATVANLLIDKQAQLDISVRGEMDVIDALADPVNAARNIDQYSKTLQEKTKQYAQDLEESNSLNPLVGIPASFRKGASRAAAEGAAQVLQNEITGFQEIQKVRTAAYSNYQTRSTLMNQEVAAAKKHNNELKAAHQVAANNGSLKASDLEFTMERAKFTKQQQDAIISSMNAKLSGKQIQLSTMQMTLEAEMQPYRLDNLKLQTTELRDNVTRRKSIEAQFHMVNPSMTLPNNWESPAVQATMDPRMVAALQETVTGTSFGQGESSFSTAVTSATKGGDPRATEYVVAMENMAEQANATAFSAAVAADPLSAKNFKPPFDKRDPLYNTKMDALAASVTSHAENVDANSLLAQGHVMLDSFRAQIDSGEINLDAAVRSGVITRNGADFVANSTFDFLVAGDGAGSQVDNMFKQFELSRKAYQDKTGKALTNAESAQLVTFWANQSLQRSNVSQHNGFNLGALTVGGVNSFSSERGFNNVYGRTVKPLKLTDNNQVLARFDAISKRAKKELTEASRAPVAAPRPDAIVDTAPTSYNWMKLR